MVLKPNVGVVSWTQSNVGQVEELNIDNNGSHMRQMLSSSFAQEPILLVSYVRPEIYKSSSPSFCNCLPVQNGRRKVLQSILSALLWKFDRKCPEFPIGYNHKDLFLCEGHLSFLMDIVGYTTRSILNWFLSI